VLIQRVHLVYEGGDLSPRNANALKRAVDDTKRKVQGVEVSFQ
jgi:hypothetical protein